MFIFSNQMISTTLLILMQLGASVGTISYKELAALLGLPTTRLNCGERSELNQLLDLLIIISIKRGIPLLSLLVVRADTGQPGVGLDRVLRTLDCAKGVDFTNAADRASFVKAEQARAKYYCQAAANDDKFVVQALRA